MRNMQAGNLQYICIISLNMLKYENHNSAHICKNKYEQICNNMHKYARPNMHIYEFQNMHKYAFICRYIHYMLEYSW